MPSTRSGLIRSILLALWALVVLALFLIEHPTILTLNPYSDLTPVITSFQASALLRAVRGFLAAGLLFLWSGLVGRSLLARLGAKARADAAAGGAPSEPYLLHERALSIATACGAGLTIATILALAFGFAGLLGLPLIFVLVATLVAAIGDNRDLLRRRAKSDPSPKPDRLLLLVLATCLFAGLVMSLSPLVATDALVYHLEIPRRYVEAGSIVRIPHNVYANMPHAAELLYAIGLAAGGEAGATLIDFGFRALLLLALAGVASRWLGVKRRLLAPCLLLTNPLILDNRTVANIDLAMALFLILSLAEILRWRETGRIAHVVVASAFAGMLAGMKYTGVLYAAALFITLLALRIVDRKGRGGWTFDLVFPLPAFLLFLPWLVKNALFTGNPIYPLLVERFGGIEWDADLGARLLAWQRSIGMGRGITDIFLLPWNMTIRGNLGYPAFDGIISPLYLMWIPALIVARPLPPAVVGVLLMAALSLSLWGWGPQQLRFFMPALPCLSLVAAHAIEKLRSRPGSAWLGRAALWTSAAYFVLFAVRIAVATVPNQLPAVVGLERAGDYLHRRFQSYDIMIRANRELPPDAKLLLVWENRGYYIERPYIADSFYEASWIMQLLEKDQEGELLANALRREGVTHILMNTLLGKHFGRAYNPRVREAMDRFVRERGRLLFEVNGLVLAELSEKTASKDRPPKEKKKPAR